MARQGNHGPSDSRAVNWSDVSRTIEALEREYGGLVKLTMDREGARNSGEALWIRAGLYTGWADLHERPIDVCAALWPTHAVRTMSGLCFRLLHQLDHAADARKRAESDGLPF